MELLVCKYLRTHHLITEPKIVQMHEISHHKEIFMFEAKYDQA
jgi:hypothetical protein